MDALSANQAFTKVLEQVNRCHNYLREAGHGHLRDLILDDLVRDTKELVAQVSVERSGFGIWRRLLTM